MFAYILHVHNDKKSNKKLMLNVNFTNDFQLILLVPEECFIFLIKLVCNSSVERVMHLFFNNMLFDDKIWFMLEKLAF